jgi:hypothetical protein
MYGRKEVDMQPTKRVTKELSATPDSLRAFVNKAISDDATIAALEKDPVGTLRAAGVGLDKDLPQADRDRFVKSIKQLHDQVSKGTLSREAAYLTVFHPAGLSAYQTYDTESHTYANVNFHQQAYTESHTHIGRDSSFKGLDVTKTKQEVISPLLSRIDLIKVTEVIERAPQKVTKTTSAKTTIR